MANGDITQRPLPFPELLAKAIGSTPTGGPDVLPFPNMVQEAIAGALQTHQLQMRQPEDTNPGIGPAPPRVPTTPTLPARPQGPTEIPPYLLGTPDTPDTPARIGTLTNTTTKSELSRVTPKEAAHLEASRYGGMRRELASTRSFAAHGAKLDKLLDVTTTAKRFQQKARQGDHYAQTEALGAQAHLKKATASFLKRNIDPDKYVREMPTFAKVLHVIAAGLGGFAEGLSQGKIKDNSMKLLNMAIDRDISSQKANMAKSLQGVNLSRAQADKLWKRYEEHQKNIKDGASEIAQLHMYRFAVKSKTMAGTIAGYRKADEIRESAIKAKAEARPKVTKVTKQRQAVIGGGTGKGKGKGEGGMNADSSKKYREGVMSFDLAKQATARIRRKLVRLKHAKATPMLWAKIDINSEGRDLMNDFRMLALHNRKYMKDSGPIRQDDVKTFDRIGANSWLAPMLEKGSMLRRLGEMDRIGSGARNALEKTYLSTEKQLRQQAVMRHVKMAKKDRKARVKGRLAAQ